MPPDPASLAELGALLDAKVVGDAAVVVRDVTHDSREAGPGVLFVAVRGFRADGHAFAAKAVDAGSPAVCVEREVVTDAAQLVVADTRRALPVLATALHDHPSRKLYLVGVTGTNGKTTVVHLIEAIATRAGKRTGVVGTVGARIGDRAVPVSRTTPEASDLQRLLAEMVGEGVEVAALEVSSHALSLHRVDGTWFEVAAFTNLSRDHLDFHGDLTHYYAAKASLFEPDRVGQAVIWVEDAHGARLAAGAPMPVTSVGGGEHADVYASDAELGLEGSRFTLVVPGGRIPVELPMAGGFNLANALIAAGCAFRLGFTPDQIAVGLAAAPVVPGRFERVDVGQPFGVVVDYAHTPEGIEAVVAAARALTAGRVILVVGAGGDRDRSKRPLMGEAASRADQVMVTSDNPRSEDPAAIMSEVAAGVSASTTQLTTEIDRRRAIRAAVRSASPGDMVLILGKGHEVGQEFADRTVAFDDREVAREELRAAQVEEVAGG